jgi:hypothetical protein
VVLACCAHLCEVLGLDALWWSVWRGKAVGKAVSVAVWDIRYCKCSTRKKTRIAGWSMFLGILFLILAGQIPPVVNNAWTHHQFSKAPFSTAQLMVNPRIGTQFGGSSTEGDDGNTLRVWIPGLVNAERVAMSGARPSMEEHGPIEFRKYVFPANASDNEGLATFTQRHVVVHTGGALESEIIVPNLAFRYMEQFLKTRSDIITDSFEDGVTPLLFSEELIRLKEHHLREVREAVFPEILEEVFLDVAGRLFGAVSANLMDEWRRGTDAAPSNTTSNHSLVLPERRWQSFCGVDPGPMASSTVERLWAWGNTFSFMNTDRVRSNDPPKWHKYVGMTGESASAETVRAFVREFGLDNPSYGNESCARTHLDQIGRWVTSLATGNDQSALRFEADIAHALVRRSLLQSPDHSLLLAAQLAYNAITGLAFYVRNHRVSGAVDDVLSVAGPSLLNSCPMGAASIWGGASIMDNQEVASSGLFSVPPEMSCALVRSMYESDSVLPISAIQAAQSGTSQVQIEAPLTIDSATFWSKIDAPRMAILIDAFTTGSSLAPFRIAGSRMAGIFLKNVRQLQDNANMATNILQVSSSTQAGTTGAIAWMERAAAARVALEEAIPGSQEAIRASQDLYSAAVGYEQHKSYWGVGILNTACSNGYLPTQLKSVVELSCYEMLDVALWMKHVAKRVAWFPRYVWRDPVTGAIDRSNMKTGPFIKTTVREALFGFQDGLFSKLFSRPYPGFGPRNDNDEGDFYARALSVPRTVINAGISDRNLIGRVMQYGPDARGVGTWGDMTPATGAFSKRRVTGTYSRLDQKAPSFPPGGELQVWDEEVRRPIAYKYSGVVDMGSPSLKLWKFSADAVQSWPYYTSDRDAESPTCLRSLGALPDWQQVPTEISLFYGKPWFLDCSESDRAYGYSRMPLANNASHESFWEVEPVSGTVNRTVTRWAYYLRWKASEWYPYLRNSIGQLAWLEETSTTPREVLESLHQDVTFITYIIEDLIPNLFNVFGSYGVIQSVVMVYVIFYPPKEPIGATERRKRRRERLEAMRRKKEARNQAEKHLVNEQLQTLKREKDLKKPGTLVMSSVLGSYAASPLGGTRGAPTMGAKLRPWQTATSSVVRSGNFTGLSTDVISVGGGSPVKRQISSKDISKMTLRDAMHTSNKPEHPDEIVETPDGKIRRKKWKRGSQAMSLSPKRRVCAPQDLDSPMGSGFLATVDDDEGFSEGPTVIVSGDAQAAEPHGGSDDDADGVVDSKAAVSE